MAIDITRRSFVGLLALAFPAASTVVEADGSYLRSGLTKVCDLPDIGPQFLADVNAAKIAWAARGAGVADPLHVLYWDRDIRHYSEGKLAWSSGQDGGL